MSLHDTIHPLLESQNDSIPRRVGKRYDAGGFLPQAGNTVVCHLDTSDPAHAAVITAREALKQLPHSDRLIFTPISSLHMTLFEGVITTTRSDTTWPAHIAKTAPVSAVTESYLERLADFAPLPAFRVRVVSMRPTGLILAGATDADEKIMRDWRDALTAPLGIRHKRHDSYQFHMTFAYVLNWLPDAAYDAWMTGLQDILDQLTAALPIIPLEPPAFCSFDDMCAFKPLKVLSA